jgi:hypothetical protein
MCDKCATPEETQTVPEVASETTGEELNASDEETTDAEEAIES